MANDLRSEMQRHVAKRFRTSFRAAVRSEQSTDTEKVYLTIEFNWRRPGFGCWLHLLGSAGSNKLRADCVTCNHAGWRWCFRYLIADPLSFFIHFSRAGYLNEIKINLRASNLPLHHYSALSWRALQKSASLLETVELKRPSLVARS